MPNVKRKHQPKDQHLVSACYLKAWCDPSTPAGHKPYIWLISADGSTQTKRAPKNSLTKTHAYTLHLTDGDRDFRVETTLSKLEGEFVRVREKIVARESLDQTDSAYLAGFISAMHARTDRFADQMHRNWSPLGEMVRSMEQQMGRRDLSETPPVTPPNVGTGTGISSADVDQFVRNLRPIGVEIALETSAPIIFRMSLAFLEAPKDSFFVTSDNPCVWVDPTAHRRHPSYRPAGLFTPEIQVTMPICPEILVLATHEAQCQGYFRLENADVQELNRRTVRYCGEQFVSRSPETLPIWFDRGTAPPDAWENRSP